MSATPTTVTDNLENCNIVQRYAWDTTVAHAICMAESHGNPRALGDTHPINGVLAPSCGLMQIRTLPGRPSCEQLYNPEFNIGYAYGLYKAHGFSPWSAYNNNSYLKYLR